MRTSVHQCNIFMHDAPPCHKSEVVTNLMREKHSITYRYKDWSDLNSIQNLWTLLIEKGSGKQQTS